MSKLVRHESDGKHAGMPVVCPLWGIFGAATKTRPYCETGCAFAAYEARQRFWYCSLAMGGPVLQVAEEEKE